MLHIKGIQRFFIRFYVSRSTIILAIFIIISASFMRQVQKFIQSIIGVSQANIVICSLVILSCAVYLFFLFKKKLSVRKTITLTGLAIICIFLIWRIKLPVERIHIMEYGFLGWMATRDMYKKNKNITNIFFAFLFCVAVGAIDELFQGLLPYRYCELRDVLLNVSGGVWGIIFYLST